MLSGVMSSNMYRLRLLSFNQEQSVSLWFSDKIACVTKIDQYAVIELETVRKKNWKQIYTDIVQFATLAERAAKTLN